MRLLLFLCGPAYLPTDKEEMKAKKEGVGSPRDIIGILFFFLMITFRDLGRMNLHVLDLTIWYIEQYIIIRGSGKPWSVLLLDPFVLAFYNF